MEVGLSSKQTPCVLSNFTVCVRYSICSTTIAPRGKCGRGRGRGDHNRLVSELGMAEQPPERWEEKVSSLQTGREKIYKEMQEMFAAMNARFDQLTATRACDEGGSSHCQNQSIGGRSSGNERPYHEESSMKYLLKLVKLDFSRFDGSKDPAS